MSHRRISNFRRVARDRYETPDWVTDVLIRHLPLRVYRIWEPACGSGKMMRVLRANGLSVFGTDITQGRDFAEWMTGRDFDAIVTNPPYRLADMFIERALELTEANRGVVAMLLQTDFDHAATRQHLISEHPAFAKKIALTQRIRWFRKTKDSKSPSYNHAWLIWDWQHTGPPIIRHSA